MNRRRQMNKLSIPTNRIKKVFVVTAAVALAALIGGIVYLRYFYGKDAPPPFELSSIALLAPLRPSRRLRGDGGRRSNKAITMVAMITAVTAMSTVAASAAKAPVAGSACTKVGATSPGSATQLRCSLVGKKKRWKAGPSAPPSTAKPSAPSSVSEPKSGSVAETATEGSCKVGAGSAAGYRVKELFVGGLAKVDAVGRSEAVTGSVSLTRSGDSLVAQTISVTVDMTKLASDESRRDGRMKTSGLETDRFPTSTFVSTGPTSLPGDADRGKPVKATINGKLTIHGVSRDVAIPVDAQLKEGVLEVVGRHGINMKDYGIDPPEIPDFVKADDDGAFEFKLVLRKG